MSYERTTAAGVGLILVWLMAYAVLGDAAKTIVHGLDLRITPNDPDKTCIATLDGRKVEVWAQRADGFCYVDDGHFIWGGPPR